VYLPNITHDYQRFNNCGPVSTSMALSYYGVNLTQYDIAPIVKGAPTDTNAAPHELSRYLQEQGFAAPVRFNGDLDTLRLLLSNQIPVIVEQWLDRPDDELTAHYRLVRGYDLAAGVIVVNDSYTGPDRRYSGADFDSWWRAFHRVYIPVYRPDQEPLVRAIIGEANWPAEVMWQQALERAMQEVQAAPNLYSWYNLGEARLRLGDGEGAVEAFEQSLAFGLPVRMPWYVFAHLEAFNATGRYERLLEVSQPYVDAHVEEIHYHRGVALEGLGRPQEALAEYQLAASLNPRLQAAVEAAARLGG
ncbi:MAG: C39 family peptidase, partial [Ardenticatenaceae bacterium]